MTQGRTPIWAPIGQDQACQPIRAPHVLQIDFSARCSRSCLTSPEPRAPSRAERRRCARPSATVPGTHRDLAACAGSRIHGGGVPAVQQGDALAEVPSGHHAGAGQQPADPRCRARGLGARRVRAAGDDRPPYRAGAAYPRWETGWTAIPSGWSPRTGRKRTTSATCRPNPGCESRPTASGVPGRLSCSPAMTPPPGRGRCRTAGTRRPGHRHCRHPTRQPARAKMTMPPENLAMSKCPRLSS